MLRSLALALALVALLVGDRVASAQAPPQCNDFLKLRGEAEQKGMAVRKAGERKAERKEICGLVSGFYTAEAAIVKFLENNKTWCGIPGRGGQDGESQSREYAEVPHRRLQRRAYGQAEGSPP